MRGRPGERLRLLLLGSCLPLVVDCSPLSASTLAPPLPPEAPRSSNAPTPAGQPEVRDSLEFETLRRAASQGVASPELKSLLEEHWEWTMATSPLWATQLGVRMHDARLGSRDRASILQDRQTHHGFLERARALTARTSLNATDKRTLALFMGWLSGAESSEVCEFDAWSISATNNAVTAFNRLPDLHELRTHKNARDLVARYRAIPRIITEQLAHYRWGLERGLVANSESIRRALDRARSQLAQPIEEWPLLSPLKLEFPDWSAEELGRFRRELRASVVGDIAPAYSRYADFLEQTLLPKGRGEMSAGLGALPRGAECYRARATWYTSLSYSPAELHAIGIRELDKLNTAMQVLGRTALGEPDLPATLRRLRTDTKLFFSDSEQILETAQAAMARANAATPMFFGRVPKAKSTVVGIPADEAPFAAVAYYRPPVPDGSKPGRYFVNLDKPETRPRYTAEVLAFHEAVPGHHLQIAISQELSDTPAFRRYIGSTAFVEGWALYSEKLADEMGLYSGDIDRLGMLNFDAWRAARLVVDTGLHALGWTRAQAEGYLFEHTALASNNIRNEVDRYLTWPGQALAYKMGQLRLLELRQNAKTQLLDKFDLRAFHEAVLGQGAVDLPLLERNVCEWIAAQVSSKQTSCAITLPN